MARPPQLFEIPDGTPESKCSACSTPIYFVRTPKGKSMPLVFHSNGLGGVRFGASHFIDCVAANQFRKKR